MAPAKKNKQYLSEKYEHQKALARERQRRRRAKLTDEEIEKKKQYDKDHYKHKKAENKIKTIKDMTPREQKAKRKYWRLQNYRRKERKAEQENMFKNTPPPSPETNDISLQKKSGRQAVRRDGAKVYRTVKKQNELIEMLEQKFEKYKKRLEREKTKSKANQVSTSPRKKVLRNSNILDCEQTMESTESEPDTECIEQQMIVKREAPDETDPVSTESVWIKQETFDELEEEEEDVDDRDDKYAQIKPEPSETHTATDVRLEDKDDQAQVDPLSIESADVKREFEEELNTADEMGPQDGEENSAENHNGQSSFAEGINCGPIHFLCTEEMSGSDEPDLRVSSDPQLMSKVIDGRKTYCCQHCRYKTTKCSSLRSHLKTHTSDRPYKCTLCPYSCSWANSLRLHTATHTGDKTHKCATCSYSSITASALKYHTATHTGDKPFKCGTCSYSGSRAYDLKVHLSTHTGEKLHKCAFCSYSNSQACNLKKHMANHTGDKPFKCGTCSYSSSRACDLKRHVTIHTGDKPFPCAKCAYKFAFKKDLNIHIARKHGGQ